MKKRRLPPRSRRNRKTSLPILSLDEQLEYAANGIVCSGLCDCSEMGGPTPAYFTILDVGGGLLSIREAKPYELLRSVEIMCDILDDIEENDKEAGFYDLGQDFDFSRN